MNRSSKSPSVPLRLCRFASKTPFHGGGLPFTCYGPFFILVLSLRQWGILIVADGEF